MIFTIINKVKNNDLVRGSFILFTGSMAVNVLAYVYNLVIGRMLGPANFGVFSSLIAMFYIISVFAGTLGLLVTKFSAEYKSQNDLSAIYAIFKYTTKKFLFIGLFLSLFFVAIAPIISGFLKISSITPVVILSLIFIISFLVTINRGILQGMLKFFSVSVISVIETILRILISVLFIYIGWSVNGALLGLTLGAIVGYGLTFIPLKKVLANRDKRKIDTQLIGKYAIPLFVSFLGMTLLYTIDVILAKHYLNDHDAGIYSALSTFGKIIFFSSSAIATALFPLAAEKNASGKAHSHLLRDSVIIVLLISVFVLGLYFFMPELVVKLFLGSEFSDSAKYLGSFGLVMLFYSIIYVLINYYLSINKTTVSYLPFIFSVILVILMMFFHSSIEQIIYIRIIHIVLLLLSIPIFNILAAKKYSRTYANI